MKITIGRAMSDFPLKEGDFFYVKVRKQCACKIIELTLIKINRKKD